MITIILAETNIIGRPVATPMAINPCTKAWTKITVLKRTALGDGFIPFTNESEFDR